MANAERLLTVLSSYLDDLEQDVQRIRADDNEFTRERMAKEAFEEGDLGIVYKRMPELSQAGIDVRVLGARTLFVDGALAMAVRAPGCLDKNLAKRWSQRAISALEKSLEQTETSCALYDLAIAYASTGRVGDAVAAFGKVAEIDGGQLGIEAEKNVGRLEVGHKIDGGVIWEWTPPESEQ